MVEPPKSADVFCNPIIGRWHISGLGCYLLVCLVATIALRLFQGLYKAWSCKYGDVLSRQKSDEGLRSKGYWYIYWRHVRGFALGKNSDLLLPTTIGFIELAAYPVLLAVGQFPVIGAWIVIKTAGGWGGWKTSTTAFNRFLLFSLLNILVAYFCLERFVQYVPCPGLRG